MSAWGTVIVQFVLLATQIAALVTMIRLDLRERREWYEAWTR